VNSDPFVLVVDDEPGILRLLKLELEGQEFHVATASNGADALKIAEEQRPDIVLLDIMMPEMGGLEVMRRLRESSDAPIILVTAKDADADKVRGLEQGADDYVAKPFSADELGARIRAVLRRSTGVQNNDRVLLAGGAIIDLGRRLVTRDGETISLTRTEWLLLQQLATNAGRVMTNAELLTKIWGAEYRDDLQYLRVWISRVRHKLEPDPADPVVIKTLQGIGYVLEAVSLPEQAVANG
jgi:two-component system KDP operon response regulator KdpE